jgi:hypothetical protein
MDVTSAPDPGRRDNRRALLRGDEVADLTAQLDRLERQTADAHEAMDRVETALRIRAEAALQHARHVLEPLGEVG